MLGQYRLASGTRDHSLSLHHGEGSIALTSSDRGCATSYAHKSLTIGGQDLGQGLVDGQNHRWVADRLTEGTDRADAGDPSAPESIGPSRASAIDGLGHRRSSTFRAV